MKISVSSIVCSAALFACCSFGATGWADQLPTKEGVEELAVPQFSPYVGRDFPTRVLWGDTHLHTTISVDAGTMCRVGQEDAYRFARGEEITTTHGLRAKLSRPLDFLVIADPMSANDPFQTRPPNFRTSSGV